MLSLGSNGSQPTDPFRIARGLRGYAHRARSCAPSSKEILPSLTRPQLLPRARGLSRALGSRSTTPPGPALGSYLAINASQGPGIRRQTPGHRCPRAPWLHSLGVPLLVSPRTWSRLGRDYRVPKTRGTHNQRLRKTKCYPQTR
jgi:hypothetical protein